MIGVQAVGFWVVAAGANLAGVRAVIPAATISRLPLYLRCLGEIEEGQTTCSSEQLAESAGVNPAQVRKDLSYVDPPGVRGVGYDVAELRALLRRELGLTREYRVAIAGAGNLGSALTMYPGFVESGFQIVAIFDSDPDKVGTQINSLTIEALRDLEIVVKARAASIGIVATPAGAAQEVADRFIGAGIRSILNFAPAVLKKPAGIEVRRVDLSTELQILAFHQNQEAG
jgi:redox-sensing transcriptional repressor